MRKVVASLFISLDGVVESPNRWQFEHFDEDMMASISAQIATEDTLLLGRITYQESAPYWPTSTDEPYAGHINSTPKYVVSTTLAKVAWGKWNNVTLINDNLVQEVTRLKQKSGKRIGVAGSPTLIHTLLQHDLLDELTLMIHPVVVGKGARLFQDGGELKRLKLLNSKMTRTGVAIHTYQPRKR